MSSYSALHYYSPYSSIRFSNVFWRSSKLSSVLPTTLLILFSLVQGQLPFCSSRKGHQRRTFERPASSTVGKG